MLIDDDVELCQEMAEALIGEGYLVETSGDGFKGKERLGKNSYDLIILDYRMPTSDGIEVLKFIKEKGIKSRVFLVSGRPFIEKLIKEENLMHCVTRIINKPFNISSLLNNIEKL